MATNEIIAKLTELAELRRLADDLAAEIGAVQDALKAHMIEEDLDTLVAGGFRITWQPVTSVRIDDVALRREQPEVWHQYGRPTTSRRFTVTRTP